VDGSREIQAAFQRTRDPGRAYPDWLDFGCGCGRIARYVAALPEVVSLRGVDVDADLVGWAVRSLPHCGRFATMRPEPPLAFGDASFDFVYAISIFTHYTEAEQLAWLDEMTRVLRPGGLLLATTIAPPLAGAFPGVSARDLARLEESGFLCVNADSSAFNERAAFHSPGYLRTRWGTRFTQRLHEPSGFVGYQDLTVWERPAPAAASPGSAASGP
jgi:SAM-dependent methyltransferase